MVFIMRLPECLGGWIIAVIADNTSALSWFRAAAHVKDPVVRALACFGMDLIISCPVPHKISGRHLAGLLNIKAGALSRFSEPPKGGGRTWASVTSLCSRLETRQAYCLPHKLLSMLATIISSATTGEQFEPQTTQLLTLEPST